MRWPRFRRPRVDLDAIVEEYGQALLADAKMMGPVVYDPRMWVRVMLDEGPYEGGLTWDQFSESMRAVEAQATEPPFYTVVEGRHWPEEWPWAPEGSELRQVLDRKRESGKLEP